jgi:membrane protein required for colicin V production
LSKVDITLALIILVGAYGGFRDGFLLELFSFLGILLGVLFGFKLMGWAMVLLAEEFTIDEKALPYIAFAGVFFVVLFIVNLFGRMLKVSADKSLLGHFDPFAGALLGLLRTAFMLSVLLWIFDSLKFHFPYGWAENSWVLPMIEDFAPGTAHGIGKIIPFFEDVF